MAYDGLGVQGSRWVGNLSTQAGHPLPIGLALSVVAPCHHSQGIQVDGAHLEGWDV